MGNITDSSGAIRVRNRALTESRNRISHTGLHFQGGALCFPLARGALSPSMRPYALTQYLAAPTPMDRRPADCEAPDAGQPSAGKPLAPQVLKIPQTQPRCGSERNRIATLFRIHRRKGLPVSMSAILVAARICLPSTDRMITALSQLFMSWPARTRFWKPGQVAEK